jgi:tetratricopeptide (TPR) repeat protein
MIRARPERAKRQQVSVESPTGRGDQPPGRKYLIIAALSVSAVCLLVFINCLRNGWVFDDFIHVLDRPQLRSLSNVLNLLSGYRPLRDISYAMDFALWGQSTVGFHFTNVAIHAANAALVFLICYRVMGDLPAALLASLIFAVHPIQTDAVAYVSGRRDILFSLFYLGAFYLYLSYCQTRSRKMLALGLACWGLSLLSKEMAASFPVVVFLWNYTKEWEHVEGAWLQRLVVSARAVLKREGWLYLGMVVVVVAYSYYDIVSLHASGRAGSGGFKYWGGSVYSNVLTELRVQAWFLKQLVYPTPITQYLGAFPVSTSILDWKVILSGVLVLSALGAGLFSLGRNRLVSFAILSYFALLLPVSQIIPHHELLADHYLYLPIFSFALLVGLGAQALARSSGKRLAGIYALATAVLITFVVLTVRQNAVWRDERSLWERNYSQVPNSPRAAYSMAGLYVSLNPMRAREMFHRCLSLDPTYAQAYLSLAALVNNREDAQDVESLIQTGLQIPDERVELTPTFTPGQFKSQLKTALAMVKGAEGDQTAAESLLWDAVSSDPTNPQPYDLLGKIYGKDKDKQMDLLIKELSGIPDSIPAREGIVDLLVRNQKFDEAIPYVMGILSINPNDVYANYQMAQIYRTKKDCPRARAYLEKAASAATTASDMSDVKDVRKQLIKECGAE